MLRRDPAKRATLEQIAEGEHFCRKESTLVKLSCNLLFTFCKDNKWADGLKPIFLPLP
jgi:hypothetical protein